MINCMSPHAMPLSMPKRNLGEFKVKIQLFNSSYSFQVKQKIRRPHQNIET